MLGMDTDICEYLIDYEVPTYDSQRHKVTLRQILNHNAGSTCTDSLLTCKGRKCPRLRKYETARPPQITRD